RSLQRLHDSIDPNPRQAQGESSKRESRKTRKASDGTRNCAGPLAGQAQRGDGVGQALPELAIDRMG
ncbi:hypothetical protein GE21DRAFT_1212112, partial [Neurospora crassa]